MPCCAAVPLNPDVRREALLYLNPMRMMYLPHFRRVPANILWGAIRFVRQSGCLAALCLIGLGGCASRVSEPTLYLLRSDPPPGVAVPAEVATARLSRWQLMLPVRVPEYLDRAALLLPQGANGVQPTFNKRWAEPLASSIPRVLAQDLNTLRGQGSVWTAPVPDRLMFQGQLRVEVLAFDVRSDGAAVTLKARWSTAGANSADAPRSHLVTITVPSSSSDADALVSAHRLALWQLAQAIADTLT